MTVMEESGVCLWGVE